MSPTETILSRALLCHENGGFAEAAQLYRQVLQQEPARPEVWHNLGLALLQQAKNEEALASFQEAIRLKPQFGEAYGNMGLALSALGRYTEAVTCYQESQRLRPAPDDFDNWVHRRPAPAAAPQSPAITAGDAGPAAPSAPDLQEALRCNTRGVECARQGRFDEAVTYFEKAIRLNPRYAEAHSNLGNIFYYQEKLEAALACYEHAVKLQPDLAIAYSNLANVLNLLKRFDEAEASCRRALQLDPQGTDVLNNLGNALRGLGKKEDAVACYEEALRNRPEFAEAHNNLAAILIDQGKTLSAIAHCRLAVRFKPDYVEAHNLLATALIEAGNLDGALASCREALRYKPDFGEAHVSLAIAYLEQSRAQEAVAAFERAQQLLPDASEPHWGRGQALLLSGNFRNGWREYEWRWNCKPFTPLLFSQPMWNGSSLPGKTIFLCAEQGFGDTLQFIRYAPLVKKHCSQLIVQCQAKLIPLVRTCAGIDTLLAAGDTLPPFDVYASLLSLPMILGTTLSTVPADIPYIAADERLVEKWRDEVNVLPGMKIGIAWQGNPDIHQDIWRSVPLAHFASLARVPGVTLVSLQKGPGADQVAEIADLFSITDWSSRLDEGEGAFMDTAAIMKCLDLVITSDTATAHLAGALGVPVWVALPFNPDFRWLLERQDSPWYPTMRLFRQKRPWEWSDVFQRIAADVIKLMAASGKQGNHGS
jgi:tetratricopeptide (TPR) repeat protein